MDALLTEYIQASLVRLSRCLVMKNEQNESFRGSEDASRREKDLFASLEGPFNPWKDSLYSFFIKWVSSPILIKLLKQY